MSKPSSGRSSGASVCGLCLRALAACALAASLAACKGENPDDLLASARSFAAQGEHKAAVIQVKNALKATPTNAEARLLLGQELLEAGDPASAEKELRRALELGLPQARVAPLLARSLFELRQFDILIGEYGTRTFEAAAAEGPVRTYVGEAHLVKGQRAEAEAAFAAALTAVPNFVPARLGQIRLAIGAGRPAEAIHLSDALMRDAPNVAEAYVLKAEALLAQGDHNAARAILQAAVKKHPDSLPSHLALVSLLLDESAFDAATAQLDAARKSARGDLRIYYFEALIAYRRGDQKKAKEQLDQVLRHAPEHVPSLVLAGAIDLAAGQTASAERNLRRALARAPTHGGARRLLVATLLRSRQPARALEALQPLVAGGVEPIPGMAMLAGETYLANGQIKQAAHYFELAAQKPAGSVAARTRLGQIALAQGDAETGFRELEAASEADPKQNLADIAIVLGHLRRNEGAKALAAARSLAEKQPNNPVSFQLLGGVQRIVRDPAGARASFERALKVAPGFLPAAYGLAELDIAEGKPGAARTRFTELLERDPKNEQIMLARAEIEFRAGTAATEVTRLIRDAVLANPQSSSARIALINHYLRTGDPRAALSAAREAAAALPSDPRIAEAQAQAEEAAGEPNLAIDSINRLVQLRPGTVEPLLRLAAAHAKQRNFERAIDALERAQRLSPENRQIDRDLVAMKLASGKPDLALRQARDLQRRAPNFAGGFVLEGDVLAAQGKHADAARLYREALKLEATSGPVAAKLVDALYSSGRAGEADAFSRRWFAENPRDPTVRVLLAGRAMRARDWKAAAAHYHALLSVDPKSVVALNNLAWIGGETGDPKAIEYAERAVQLAPKSASVLDTLGMLLVKRGDPKRGVEILAKARALAPDRLDLRLNFAKALVDAGDKDRARKELRAIVAAKEASPEGRAAAELLMSL